MVLDYITKINILCNKGKIFILSLIFCFIMWLLSQQFSREILISIILWIEKQSYITMIPIIFLLYVVCNAPTFLPTNILHITCGFIFGTFNGFVIAILCYTFSAFIPFIMTRYCFKTHVENEFIESKYYSLIEVINDSPVYMLFCARMSPIIPGSLNNLLFGLTDINNAKYLYGSVIGIAPQLFLFVYIGSCLEDLTKISTKDTPREQLILMFIGVFLTIIMVSYLMIKTSQQIKKKSLGSSVSSF